MKKIKIFHLFGDNRSITPLFNSFRRSLYIRTYLKLNTMIFDWANSVMFNGRSYYVVEDYGVVTAVPEYAEPNMYGQYPQ